MALVTARAARVVAASDLDGARLCYGLAVACHIMAGADAMRF